MKVLVFGAGVIGSLYAVRFSSAGFDVALLARGKRLEALREKGLLYDEKGSVKKAPIKIINELRDDDIYDYIFVTVRYEQVESALITLEKNQSKNIVTLTNAIQYSRWIKIIGDKLIPGFPGAGGDIKEDILYAKIGSKNVQGTIFGEINGEITERVKNLSKVFETAGIPFEIAKNIQAFHITHAAVTMAMKHFYTGNGMVDIQTAKTAKILKSIATDIKNNIRIIENAGIPVTPQKIGMVKKIPEFLFSLAFYIMLNIGFTRDVLFGNHSYNAKNEILLLDSDFNSLYNKN
jgi:2-dehydropantoate 2-reductase